MTHTHVIGKYLLILGVIIFLVGVVFYFLGKVPWLGRLPGDIFIKRGSFCFYFPITTSILISGLVSLACYLFFRK
ncbi:MAG: DUF2905 domain-containing protein [Candidatus Omnitrophota bacterium]